MTTSKEEAAPWPVPSQHPLYKAIVPQMRHRAPILVHLNADTSWLLLIPYPTNCEQPSSPPQSSSPSPDPTLADDGFAPRYFKLLIDPWFVGPQVDYYTWFSSQTHVVNSCVQSIAELEHVLRGIERASQEHAPTAGVSGDRENHSDDGRPAPRTSPIDAVLVAHEFTDHCHRATLTQLPANTPVLAGPAAAKMIRGWKHFSPDKVHGIRPFSSCVDATATSQSTWARRRRSLFSNNSFSGKAGQDETEEKRSEVDDKKQQQQQPAPDWRLSSFPGLPDWLGVSQIFSPQKTSPKPSFHAGALITFRRDGGGSSSNGTAEAAAESETAAARAVIYTPHGLTPSAVKPLARARPPVRALALLQGLDEMRLLGGLLQLNLGARPGLLVARAAAASFWVGTHEEAKAARGIVASTLQRVKVGLVEAIEEDAKEVGVVDGGKGRVVGLDEARREGDVVFAQLESGEALALVDTS